jgi:hypothetical protein
VLDEYVVGFDDAWDGVKDRVMGCFPAASLLASHQVVSERVEVAMVCRTGVEVMGGHAMPSIGTNLPTTPSEALLEEPHNT